MGNAARQIVFRVMGAAPPWGQSLLRSCLAAHSFPPPPPHEGGFARLGLPQFRIGSYFLRPELAVYSAERRRFGGSRMSVSDVPTADSTSRGVAAGRSAQRGTSGATTGGGGRSAPDPYFRPCESMIG